jgi:hypothetical protein
MTSELSEQAETHQERLLRVSLREHAPAEVDAENAWAATVQRLSFSLDCSVSHSPWMHPPIDPAAGRRG